MYGNGKYLVARAGYKMDLAVFDLEKLTMVANSIIHKTAIFKDYIFSRKFSKFLITDKYIIVY
jgi:hypothetical protein